MGVDEKRLYKLEMAISVGFKADVISGVITSPTGKVCTARTVNGYTRLTIRKKGYKTVYLTGHQFVYYIKHKEVVDCIDHINGNKTDNRIENLRSVSKSVNALNTNKTKGVSFDKRNNKFSAYITIDYCKKFLGYFEKESEAIKAREDYRLELINKLTNK